MYVVLDFETVNCGGVDLTAVGSSVYAQHPLTEILSLTYEAVGGISIWRPDADYRAVLTDLVNHPEVLFVAHGAGFEKDIWRYIMVAVHGFPDIPNARWRDTQAVCAWKAIPLGLEDVADILELKNRKDSDGHKLMRSLTRANKAGVFDLGQERLNSVYTYNKRDILCQSELNSRIGQLSVGELSVWQLDQTINERGIRIDTDYCRAGLQVVERASVPLLSEFKELTGLRPGQRDKFIAWCETQGEHRLYDLTKDRVASLIGPEDDTHWETADTSKEVARALRIRQLVNHSSIKKLQRMIDCTGYDNVARRLVQYHGAGTGRWTGRLFQPQNFPRGTVRIDGKPPNPEDLVSAIMTGDPQYVEAVIGSPAIECVSSGLRHAMVARSGRIFNSGDFARVECYLDLAMAGQHDKCELIASGFDPYCDMATQIYGREITKADVEQRQTGKNTILGCGFQMGPDKFCQRYVPECMCKGTGAACQFQDSVPRQFAGTVIRTYRKDWAPEVPRLWFGLEDAALRAVQSGKKTEAYGVEFKIVDQWLTAHLPSGNTLWYFNPRIIQKTMPWTNDYGEAVVKTAWRFTSWSGEDKRYQTVDAYGGIITNNVIQAMARQLMVEAMFVCEREGFPIVLTVHDEILTEPVHSDLKALEQIMTSRPAWAEAIKVPIQIEAWEGTRYKK